MADALPKEVRALHVDDDRTFLDLVGEVFRREFEGFAVTRAADPEEGLEALSREPFDCVVSDYDIPGMDGLEFLDSVRAEHLRLPFVLFTGKGSEEMASPAKPSPGA